MDDVESQYLDQLHRLTDEMDVAMNAIATDDPASFAESVARQEVYVFNLATLRNRRLMLERSAAVLAAETDLLRAIKQYSTLLRHSSQTIAILSTLCDSHLGVRKEDRGTRSRRQTWSCEM